jgi:hypothetical protein
MEATMLVFSMVLAAMFLMNYKRLDLAYELSAYAQGDRKTTGMQRFKNFLAFAKVLPGEAISDIRGKLGNTVFTPGRSVLALRKRVKPKNPQSASQSEVRADMALYSSAWDALTDGQRLGWINAAATTVKKNIFGAKYNTTGNKLFIAFNMEASMNGGTSTIDSYFIPTAPTAIVNGSALAASSSAQTITFTASGAAPTNGVVIVEATPGLKQGISNVKGKYRVVLRSAKAASATTIGNLTAAYTARLGALIQGTRIYVKLYTTNNDATGQVIKYASSTTLSCIVS